MDIPKASNPSKLILHRWNGETWVEKSTVRFVPIKEGAA